MSAACLSVFDRYKSYSPYDMKESIRKEVKGDLEKSFLTLGNARHISITSSPQDHIITTSSTLLLMCLCVVVTVECFENKQLYFANRLSEAMKVTLPVDSVLSGEISHAECLRCLVRQLQLHFL